MHANRSNDTPATGWSITAWHGDSVVPNWSKSDGRTSSLETSFVWRMETLYR